MMVSAVYGGPLPGNLGWCLAVPKETYIYLICTKVDSKGVSVIKLCQPMCTIQGVLLLSVKILWQFVTEILYCYIVFNILKSF